MKPDKLIRELEVELTKMGVRVRREKGSFKGGWCVVNDEECLMINKRQSAETQFAILAEAIRTLPLDSVYLKPNVRSALEDQWARRPQDPSADSDD
ncbi:hypothetical protein ACFLRO_00850 [Bacteroidota bacterium]